MLVLLGIRFATLLVIRENMGLTLFSRDSQQTSGNRSDKLIVWIDHFAAARGWRHPFLAEVFGQVSINKADNKQIKKGTFVTHENGVRASMARSLPRFLVPI